MLFFKVTEGRKTTSFTAGNLQGAVEKLNEIYGVKETDKPTRKKKAKEESITTHEEE